MSTLKRCATATQMEPKFIHYHSNGSGRDSYIGMQNGGMWKDIQITAVRADIGTFGSKRKYQTPAPIMVPKFRHYHSDGTGRDNYVIQDEGGLAPSSTKFKRRSNFFTELRQYERKLPLPEMDFFRLAQTPSGQSFKQYVKTQEIANSQVKLNKRLNTPKIVEDAYKPMRTLSAAFYGKKSQK